MALSIKGKALITIQHICMYHHRRKAASIIKDCHHLDPAAFTLTPPGRSFSVAFFQLLAAAFKIEYGIWRPGDCQPDRSESVKLRLMNGGSRCAGRLEVHYRGIWWTVRSYTWDLQDATVVCRELGCGKAVDAPGGAHFGAGSGPVIIYNVQCNGNEATLRECKSSTWDHYGGSHSNDTGVICSGMGELRLVGGENRCAGRVEVLHGGQWGTLCDEYFSLEDASVVCEQLQCGAVKPNRKDAYFGEGKGPLWKDNYRCLGNESRLADCPVSTWGQISCSHANDASVICTNESWSLRLNDGGSRCDGRVEMYDKGTWRRVQDKFWTINEARVVCRQLRCGSAIAAYNCSKYRENKRPVLLIELQCEGDESHLRNCKSSMWKRSSSDITGIGVLCSGEYR
ncbi:scavenger receptor cysteine-rich domain-containing protein DMBT1-like [Mobula birostris]|uniref:scavenger receptor cysteine-rich domain-containing protein DMBT1-like n=1 Tax=Mobula birostris TaxID=1983395 RepID=UPI003B2832F9